MKPNGGEGCVPSPSTSILWRGGVCTIPFYLYPLFSVLPLDIITKSGALFIFIHKFVYPPSILSWNLNSPQLLILSLPSTCLMKVPLHVFAPDSARCCPFNPIFCHLFVSIPSTLLEALKCKISLYFFNAFTNFFFFIHSSFLLKHPFL